MERIICKNYLIISRNRFLFWIPNSRIGSGDRSLHTMRNYTSAMQLNVVHNHIHCRHKSSAPDGNAPPKLDSIPRGKVRKLRTLKTNVTQVTESTLTQKQQLVKLVTGANFPKIMNQSIPNVKSEHDSHILPLYEMPMISVGANSNVKLDSASGLLPNFISSFENFLRLNPQRFNIAESNEREENLTQLLAAETELQKEFDPNNQTEHNGQRSLNDSLKCYINACISVNLTERAFAELMSIRQTQSYKRYKIDLNNIELFGDLMREYSAMGNWSRVNELYEVLVAEKIPITPQIYMNILDCLGRTKKNESNSVIRKFIKKANEQGISLNDIMNKSTFIRNQKSKVLHAIRKVHASFEPVYDAPQLEYSNKLLLHLNENLHNITIAPQELMRSEEKYLISQSKQGVNSIEINEFMAEQIKNEFSGNIVVKNIAMMDSQHLTDNVKYHREILEKLTDQWRVDITNAVRKRLGILKHKMNTSSAKFMNIYPYLRLLTPEQYTEILLDELKSLANGSELYSPTTMQIYGNLGLKVMHKYQYQLREQNGVTEKVRELYKTYQDILCSEKCPDNPRQLWQSIVHHARPNGPCVLQPEIMWPWSVQYNVGRTLFRILMDYIKIDANLLETSISQAKFVPIIYSLYRNRDATKREEIMTHPVFTQLVRDAKIDTMKFNTNEVPMLCPPIPWTSAVSGGYLHSNTILLRLPPQFTHQSYLTKSAPPEQLYPSLDAINQLGSIPWRINTRILDLAIKIFKLGGNEKLDVPLTPDNMLTKEHLKYRGISMEDLQKMKRNSDDKYHQRQNELLSLYTDTLYKLSLANHFRDRPFWLPTNLDFHGRCYPVPPHLTHLSADLTRSMLCFHQKQPLGESGLDWLKLHCINLTGMKKRHSIADRSAYINEIIDEVIDSADNPLDGRKWWLKSDDPWQTLAACCEIVDAMRSPNPAEFMSGFPIHQDGSCNGLQHYAALGRDFDGATSVNLAPSNVPQDVYSTIANRVEEMRKQDAADGLSIAISLEGRIKRKIVKQTVMTTVYGVTGYGARLQIRKQLKNIHFPSELLKPASLYLTQKTFDSLSAMFKSAREIQDWLTESAQYIASKDRSRHVEWTSPLGLPIIQPYTSKNPLQSNVTIHTSESKSKTVNRIKEKNAFSPNFIHSLDSCHMMLTSLNCERAGLSFVSVHDCFWTHPSTVGAMNRICREQFILLHSQPILEDLAESFYQKYELNYQPDIEKKPKRRRAKDQKKDKEKPKVCLVPRQDHIFMKLPKKGTFNLNDVLNSTYFFS